MADLTATFDVSQRRACELVGLHRSNIRQRPAPREDEARLVEAILELVGRHPRYGYRRIWVLLVRAGLVELRGAPGQIRSNNGPEFIAGAIWGWLAGAGVGTLYVEPGSPWENGYAESFHSRVRDEFLGVEEFASVTEAKVLAGQWRREYNHERPHSSLGYKTPAEYGELCPRHGIAQRSRGEDTIG